MIVIIIKSFKKTNSFIIKFLYLLIYLVLFTFKLQFKLKILNFKLIFNDLDLTRFKLNTLLAF